MNFVSKRQVSMLDRFIWISKKQAGETPAGGEVIFLSVSMVSIRSSVSTKICLYLTEWSCKLLFVQSAFYDFDAKISYAL